MITKYQTEINTGEQYVSKIKSQQVTVTIDAEWQPPLENPEILSPKALEVYNSVSAKGLDDSVKPIYPLSLQIEIERDGIKNYYLFLDDCLYDSIQDDVQEWEKEKRLEGLNVDVIPSDDLTVSNHLQTILELTETPTNLPIELVMFYSPQDLTVACGWDYISKYFLEGLIEQKRNIKINVKKNKGQFIKLPSGHQYQIKDVKGWSGGGLASFLQSTNIKSRAKGDLDDLKSRMVEAFTTKTKTALEYSLGDVEDLSKAHDVFQELIWDVGCNQLGVKMKGRFPSTTGSLVSRYFETWLNQLEGVNLDKLRFAYQKLALLDDASETYKNDRKLWNGIVNSIKTPEKIENRKGEIFERSAPKAPCLFDRFLRIRPQYAGYGQASVKYYAHKGSVTTEGFNALVQGGRCNNENPAEYQLGHVLDIDLKSCYGSALKKFNYPVGLPTNYGFTSNEERPTLREFLKEVGSELVDGLWTITVDTDTRLSFEQDLIFSKLSTLRNIRTAYIEGFKDGDNRDYEISDWGVKEDPANIAGDFVLLTQEIRNGILTSEVLNTIKAVATNQEWGELQDNLKVVSASIYRKSDMVESLDEWTNRVIRDKGRYGSKTGKVIDIKDGRTRAWYPVPLDDYLKNLFDERAKIKKLKKTQPELAAKDAMLKLQINTLYGVIASPYFSIGNTVVANNITAKARVGAWMMAKALHLRMVITDGGFYTPTMVPYLDSSVSQFRKPGLNELANQRDWGSTKVSRKRGQKFTMLAGDDWVAKFKELATKTAPLYAEMKSLKNVKNPSEIIKVKIKEVESQFLGLINDFSAYADDVALTHINQFWKPYGLQLNFDIEHKEKHAAINAAYYAKGHYAFLTPWGEKVKKIRGTKDYKEPELRKSPYYEIFDNVLSGSDEFPAIMEYDHRYLLKISEWSRAQDSDGYLHLKGVRPGSEVTLERVQTIKCGHHRFQTVRAYEKIKKRKTHRTVNGERVKIQGFERYGKFGISGVFEKSYEDAQKVNELAANQI